MSENDKRLKKEQMIDVIIRTALGLEAKLLVLHDSYNIYHKNYSPEALELYAGFGNYSDAVYRMIESGQLGRLPSEILKKLLEYSLDVSERLSLEVRMPTNQKKSKGDEIQSDVDGNKNGNLYHYAGNNPVWYVDPDGCSGWEMDLFEYWMEETSNGCPLTQQQMFTDFVNGANQQFCYHFERIQKNIDKGIIGGMRFIAEHGDEISLICYVTGQVQLGAIIDGVSFTCDVSIAIYDYQNSGKTNADKIRLGNDLTTTVVSTLASGKFGEVATKGFYKLGREEFNKKLTNMMSNVIGSEFDTCVDSFVEESLK